MKRSGIARGTTRMRRGRMKAKNQPRLDKRDAKNFGPLAVYVRKMDCCACHKYRPSQAAHVKSRGSGGHAFNEHGEGDIIPFCGACHGLQGTGGWSAVPWHDSTGTRVKLSAADSREHAEFLAERIGEEFLEAGGERY